MFFQDLGLRRRENHVMALRRNDRTAGLIYMLLVLAGPLRLIYIPNVLFVTGDATATAANISANEMLFRAGMATDLVAAVILIYLTLALYKLFSAVSQTQAVLVVLLGGVLPGTLYIVNVVNDAAALLLVQGADYLSVFDNRQRAALAFLFLRIHHQMDIASEILWGLWLLPLAFLAWKSRFVPRLVSAWLTLAGVSYVVLSFTGELLPRFENAVLDAGSIPRLGELAFALWLAIVGVKRTAVECARVSGDASLPPSRAE
ncbi:MAG: DUF4386 domain-containing protein [Dokdonella sp.]